MDEKVDKIVPSPIVPIVPLVFVYSAGHFVVDFACAFLLCRFVFAVPDAHINVLLYNFCAFAMQAPLGIIADKINRNYLFAIAGCALIAVAYGFWYFPLAAVFCAGLGNAMFHIGGGIDILNISGEKAGALGVFVSPGALGIFFGATLGRRGAAAADFIIPIFLTLIIIIVLILSTRFSWNQTYLKNAPFSLDGGLSPHLLIAAVCLFLVVCIRSYTGLVLDFPWKSAGIWSVILACAAAFGKCLGGILSDRFGKINIAGVSLSIAALLFLFLLTPVTGVASATGVAAVLLFNMTMPLTLWAMAKIFPGAKGFSFGLLSFALFIGYLPAYSGISPLPGTAWWFSATAVVSIPLLFVGLKTVSAFFVSYQSDD